MQFAAYIRHRKLKLRAAARELGEKYETCRLWATGQRVPRPKTQLKIQAWSRGRVRPEDWIAQATREAA